MSSLAPTAPHISSRGQIENLQRMGFTDPDALSEMADNAIDAGATTIQIRMDTAATTLYVSDNGRGMDQPTLHAALLLHDTKPASDAIGMMGLGLKAATAVLSSCQYPTYVFSKTSTGDACEICADWPKVMEANMWNPTAADISAKRSTVWTQQALDREHGTVIQIRMLAEKFAGLKDSVPSLLAELGRRFDVYRQRGVIITIVIDDEVHPLTADTAVGWDGVEHRYETPIEILYNDATKEERIYFQHVSLRPAYTEMVRRDPTDPRKKKVLRDYQEAIASGFVIDGEFILRGTYSRQWDGTQGYLTLRRGKRYLSRLDTAMPGSGDLGARKVVRSSRHELCYTHHQDKHFGRDVNKSRVTPENIHPGLLAIAKGLARTWSEKIFKANYNVPVGVVVSEFKKEIAQAKKRFNAVVEAYPVSVLPALEAWLATFRAEEEEDEEEEEGEGEDEEV